MDIFLALGMLVSLVVYAKLHKSKTRSIIRPKNRHL